MALVPDIIDTALSSLTGGGATSSKNYPTFLLEDGTVISFQIIDSKKRAVGTKDNDEVYVGEPSAFFSYLKLAKKAAEVLDTVILKESPPISEEEDPSVENEIEYQIQGKVISDPEGEPIGGAKVKSQSGKIKYNKKVKTEETGDFTLIGNYLEDTLFKIKINAKGYGPETLTPFNQDKTLKKNLGIIILKSNKKNTKEQRRKELLLPEPQVKAIKFSKMNPDMAKQQAMNKLMTTIKTVLIPAVLAQLMAFGISKASEAIGKKFGDMNATCPANIDELNKLIAKKNRLVTQLNNIYKTLERIEVVVKTIDTILTAAQIVVGVIKALSLAFPAVPFAPDLTKASTIQGGPLDKVELEIKKYKLISSITVMILAMLISALQYILDLLAALDIAIQGCAKEISTPKPTPIPITIPSLTSGEIEDIEERGDEISIDGEDISQVGIKGLSQEDVDVELLAQTQISQELLDSTQAQSQQLSPVVTNVNGFDMGVETEVTDNPLKRRRAIAKNTEGVVILTGEYSYSSNDQILIDELVFYIQTNDLKAK